MVESSSFKDLTKGSEPPGMAFSVSTGGAYALSVVVTAPAISDDVRGQCESDHDETALRYLLEKETQAS